MSTALVASTRIHLTYVVGGMTHNFRAYVKEDTVPATPVNLQERGGLPIQAWTYMAQGLWSLIASILSNGEAHAPAAKLERHVVGSGIWNLIDVYSPTGGGAHGGSYVAAQQTTYVLRDTGFKFIRWIVLEAVLPLVGHSNNGLGLGADLDGFTPNLTGVVVDHAMPFYWQISRGGNFIAPSGAVAGLTLDINDKLRRRRGLA